MCTPLLSPLAAMAGGKLKPATVLSPVLSRFIGRKNKQPMNEQGGY